MRDDVQIWTMPHSVLGIACKVKQGAAWAWFTTAGELAPNEPATATPEQIAEWSSLLRERRQ